MYMYGIGIGESDFRGGVKIDFGHESVEML